MALVRLISPEGEEVVATESGVESLKELGYKDAPKPKAKAASPKKAAADSGEED